MEEDRMLRIFIQSAIVVFIWGTKPIWMKWLVKLGYRDWRDPSYRDSVLRKHRQKETKNAID